jgi:hypothetical protein
MLLSQKISRRIFDSGQRVTRIVRYRFVGSWAGIYLGGHDVEDSRCRTNCTFHYSISTRICADRCQCCNPKRCGLEQSDGHEDRCRQAALKLTPDQEKYWSAIEDAIRARAKNRQARLTEIEKRVTSLREGNPVEVLRNRDPIDFLQWRADALAQRSADLKKTSRCVGAAV